MDTIKALKTVNDIIEIAKSRNDRFLDIDIVELFNFYPNLDEAIFYLYFKYGSSKKRDNYSYHFIENSMVRILFSEI